MFAAMNFATLSATVMKPITFSRMATWDQFFPFCYVVSRHMFININLLQFQPRFLWPADFHATYTCKQLLRVDVGQAFPFPQHAIWGTREACAIQRYLRWSTGNFLIIDFMFLIAAPTCMDLSNKSNNESKKRFPPKMCCPAARLKQSTQVICEVLPDAICNSDEGVCVCACVPLQSVM